MVVYHQLPDASIPSQSRSNLYKHLFCPGETRPTDRVQVVGRDRLGLTIASWIEIASMFLLSLLDINNTVGTQNKKERWVAVGRSSSLRRGHARTRCTTERARVLPATSQS